MKTHTLLFALTLIASAAPTASAQRVQREPPPRGWLGIAFNTVLVEAESRRLVIREVVAESPAQRAGLEVGDTLLRINGLNATEELMVTLGLSLSPGDTVRVLVRRSGGDREFTMQAAERPARYAVIQPDTRILVVDPDSLRGMIHILMDSVRTRIDSLDFPRVYIERGRIVPELSDNLRYRFQSRIGDRFVGDSIRLRVDTVWKRLTKPFKWTDGRYTFSGFIGDSVWRKLPAYSVRIGGDSSTFMFEKAWPGFVMVGPRAIAGAQLDEVSPGVAEYFGVQDGLLVMRVPAGTPAARTGLQEGDVIVRANGDPVSTLAELRSAVARAGATQPVRLEVVRKRQRLTLELKRE